MRPRLLITVATSVVVLEAPCLVQGQRQDRHDLVAVHIVALVVHGQAAVRVAVMRDAEVRTVLHHSGFEGSQVGGPDAVVDVQTVRFGADHHYLGSGVGEHLRRAAARGTVRAIQDDFQALKPMGKGAEQMNNVPVLGVREPLDAADLAAGGAPRFLPELRLDGILDLVRQLLAAAGEELDSVVRRGVVGGGEHDAESRRRGRLRDRPPRGSASTPASYDVDP